MLRRIPDGSWPDRPRRLLAGETLRLDSIGFTAPLLDAYRNSGLP